tara:strand:- start:1003 stop:1305 length:303 start_codon:yes stop_codon:yes gene_type:complete
MLHKEGVKIMKINLDIPHWKIPVKDKGLLYTCQVQDSYLVVEVLHITHDSGDGIVDATYAVPLDRLDVMLGTFENMDCCYEETTHTPEQTNSNWQEMHDE